MLQTWKPSECPVRDGQPCSILLYMTTQAQTQPACFTRPWLASAFRIDARKTTHSAIGCCCMKTNRELSCAVHSRVFQFRKLAHQCDARRQPSLVRVRRDSVLTDPAACEIRTRASAHAAYPLLSPCRHRATIGNAQKARNFAFTGHSSPRAHGYGSNIWSQSCSTRVAWHTREHAPSCLILSFLPFSF